MTSVKAPWIRAWVVGMVIVCGAQLVTRSAEASPTEADRARATELFHEGRARMAAARYAEACAMLEESQRLDPGGGTLLNVALCHELQGRLATAASDFQQAIEVARLDGRPDREAEAARHLRGLTARVPRMTIEVPPEARMADLVVRRDGIDVVASSWGTPVPADPGEHVVEAAAPGRSPWATTIVVRDDGATLTVRVPALEPLPPIPPPAPVEEPPAAPAAPSTPLAAAPSTPPAAAPSTTAAASVATSSAPPTALPLADEPEERPQPEVSPRPWQRPTAIGVGVLGLAGLGVGAVFGLRAAAQWSDAQSGCSGGVCTTSQAYNSWRDSRTSAAIATAAFVVAGVGIPTGVVLWLTAPASRVRVDATLGGLSASAEF
jgi:hypothetical protein